MATTKSNRATTTGDKKSASQAPKKQKPAYVTRYVAVESHLSERSGSTDFVYGLAGERPAGRKLAQDVANACNQLHSEGYEVISILPLSSGRTVEATVESEERVHGRTYTKNVPVEPESANPSTGIMSSFLPVMQYEQKHYIDTGVGYSVTDGVVITAKIRS